MCTDCEQRGGVLSEAECTHSVCAVEGSDVRLAEATGRVETLESERHGDWLTTGDVYRSISAMTDVTQDCSTCVHTGELHNLRRGGGGGEHVPRKGGGAFMGSIATECTPICVCGEHWLSVCFRVLAAEISSNILCDAQCLLGVGGGGARD